VVPGLCTVRICIEAAPFLPRPWFNSSGCGVIPACGDVLPRLSSFGTGAHCDGCGFTYGQALNSTRFPIGSFTVPSLDWDCKLVVTGKVHAVGVELDSSPLLVGCEVRLGNEGESECY